MKIGIFSGSFNPIHVGHLILGNYIVEYTDMDQVWFVVTPHNPLKEEDSLLSENHRLEMVRLATEQYEKLLVSDFEFSLPRPSYTLDTLSALGSKYPEHEFSLIIGGDNWDSFEEWKDYKTIINEYKIVIYPRLDSKLMIPASYKNVKVLDSPIIEISSSFIRDAIKDNKNIRPFLPLEVYRYIEDNNIYR